MRRPIVLAFAAALSASPVLSQTCEDRGSDYAARIALCDQALAEATSSDAAAWALALKGEAQRLMGDFDAARASLQQALGYMPQNAWVWVELGNVSYDLNDTAGALAYYSAALAVEDQVDAWANRADTWWQFREGQRCSDDADNALRIDPQFAYANEVKGRCLIDLGRAEEAIGYFDTALSLAPGYQNAYRNKLAALAALGRYPEVVAVADEALSPGVVANPVPDIEEDIRSRRLLALAEYETAEKVASEADALLALFPKNLAAINVRGHALLAAGKPEEADAATAVLRQNPDGLRMDGAYLDTLAQIDVALGRLEDALANYTAALNASPELSKAYARSLSGLGFLPLSNTPEGVLTALRRCIDVKKTACRVAG
jgi:tetratricopeptide (TPR) repeat protein